MLSKSDSPRYIAEEFGRRLKRLRLNKNLRQIDVAAHSGLSRKIILNAEIGNVTLENLIQILYTLNALDDLDSFLPEPPLSPIEPYRVCRRPNFLRNYSDEKIKLYP